MARKTVCFPVAFPLGQGCVAVRLRLLMLTVLGVMQGTRPLMLVSRGLQ